MSLIVYGHVAAWGPLTTLPPVNVKQFGVAFFLFSTGYSLAQEMRDRWRVVFNRLFELYLFGVALALLLSILTYVTVGRLQLSNYYPFFAGSNVFLDYFPANPTTWYLGTYVHVVLLWAALRDRIRVSPRVLGLGVVAEMMVRAGVMVTAGRFTSYMLLSNWSSVLLLGHWYGQNEMRGIRLKKLGALPAFILLTAAVAGWSVMSWQLPFEAGFPFMHLRTAVPLFGEVIVSALVTTLYVGATWLTFCVVAPLPAPRFVRFIARNTLIIFLAHMPLFYAMWPVLMGFHDRVLSAGIMMIACLPGLALVSEGVRGLVRTRELRGQLYERLRGRRPALRGSDAATG
jgi:hypothetical protein